ncbi:hypothetical protein ACLVXC_003876 [Vibrio alginolyticus]|uniref:Uncharacterized protein n=1 Tax=Vibrio spartinae TaxID=1918945 RepID=A0A1N6M7S4_9VIBR|nr:hypothetical protein [Vibrio spartinae]EHJ9984789.1 hypothetical protein [Vibrio parahaemolyticus]ELA7220493.1 hypothetical protein [Vibrio parahaemolyticus]SIO95498.1 hypothetical protein VSP9026_03243 [Vibrio spartinae]
MVKVRKNSWPRIVKDLYSRLGNALKSITFIAFFLIGVIVIGGIGVWLPYGLDGTSDKVFFEAQNVLTFYLAILGTLSIEGVISKSKNTDLAALGLIIGVISLILGIYGYYNYPTGSVWQINLGAFITLTIFLFSTVNDEKFDVQEEIISDATGYEEADKDLIKDKK